MNPSGEYGTYDKRHLFRLGDENLHYTQGKSQLIRNIGEWRIKSLICYDLRFPVWSRNRNDYDLLVYIANWPESRREVWKTLLKARAIENQAFVIGVNRIGSDGNGIDYSGDTMVVDPKGNVTCLVEPYLDRTDTITLSLKEVRDFRKNFPVGLDADDFELIL
jgi:predicted amidohydrolase